MFPSPRFGNYRLSSDSPVLQGQMYRERMHCAKLSLQGRQPEFLPWNTKFVEYPRSGNARIGCEASPARMGPAAGTHRGTL